MVVLLISWSSFFWVTDCFPVNTLFRLFVLFGAYYFKAFGTIGWGAFTTLFCDARGF
jgi:hypothetical protein